MNIQDLKKEMAFKWRVQSFSKYKPQGQCVAYIDARDVMKRLDEVCGDKWQSIYYEAGTMLFCKIGIKIGDEWIWRSDTGSESNIEKEKGHSSDAFKRAGVMWGVGQFLYSMDIQYVTANEEKTNSNHPYVVDAHGQRVWDLTKHINGDSHKNHTPKKLKTQPKGMTTEQQTWVTNYCIKEKIEDVKAFAEHYHFSSKTTPPEKFEIIKKQIIKEQA